MLTSYTDRTTAAKVMRRVRLRLDDVVYHLFFFSHNDFNTASTATMRYKAREAFEVTITFIMIHGSQMWIAVFFEPRLSPSGRTLKMFQIFTTSKGKWECLGFCNDEVLTTRPHTFFLDPFLDQKVSHIKCNEQGRAK